MLVTISPNSTFRSPSLGEWQAPIGGLDDISGDDRMSPYNRSNSIVSWIVFHIVFAGNWASNLWWAPGWLWSGCSIGILQCKKCKICTNKQLTTACAAGPDLRYWTCLLCQWWGKEKTKLDKLEMFIHYTYCEKNKVKISHLTEFTFPFNSGWVQ